VLNGALSEDPENAPLTFAWTQTGGPAVSLATPGAATATFTAPQVGPAGTTLTFRLVVSEGPGGQTATDFVQIGVRDLPAYGELSPSPLDFGVRTAGVKVTKAVTLRNIGPGPLVVGTFQVTGSTTFGFDGANCGTTLAPNASCSLKIRFTPPPSGSVSGKLVVGTPNSPNPSVSIQLRGEGGTPTAALSAGSLSFGQVNMGASDSQQIRLSNTGIVPVTIASVTTGVGTGFSHTGCPAAIPAGGSCLITVTFTPSAAGPAGTWLVIDDDGGGPRWVQLSGIGVAVGVSSASPSALAFGSLGVGNTSGAATVGLTNVGGAPLYVWDVRVSGHYADFRIVSDRCRGVSLQPWSGCVVEVVFEPQATGARTGTLEFAANGVVSTTLTGTGVGKPAQTAWAQLGFGAARGGFNVEEWGIDAVSATSLATQWELPLKAEARTSPAVVDGVAYVGTDDGTVYAVELAGQTLLWNAQTGGAVRSSPAVVDGVVYVGSDDGNVYAFEAGNGLPLWTFKTGGPVEAAPAVDGPVAIVGSLDGNVYALDVATGKELWTNWSGGPVSGSPALAGSVAFAAGGNWIRAYDLKTGSVLWTEFANGPVQTAVTVADGRVLVGSDGGWVSAFSAASGAPLWHFDASSVVASSPAAAYGIVFAGSDGGELTALDAATGAGIWSLQIGASRSAVAVANGVVYVTTEDGRLLAVDAWSGVELAAVDLKALSSPAVTGGTVYVGTASGLAALAP
jgi:outer membrane protein assembly factor BamB